MKATVFSSFVLVLALGPIHTWSAHGPDALVALVGGTVIDGNDGAPLRDAVIVIKDDRIVSVGPRGKSDLPKAAKIIDTAGKFLLPGLIDIHVHGRQRVDTAYHGDYSIPVPRPNLTRPLWLERELRNRGH